MKNIIIKILMVLCLVVALGCGGYLAYYYYNSNKSEDAIEKLKDKILSIDGDKMELQSNHAENNYVEVDGVKIQKKFEKLYGDNQDFIGWLQIDDTNIDYPVMYSPGDSENGEYYIHRDFYGQYSSAGLPFVDRNCLFEPVTDNLIVYGHNMNAGTMFHDLLKYEEEDFYHTHTTFEFDTIYEDGEYEVVAVFRGQIFPGESDNFKYYEFVNAGSEEEFMNYVENIRKMSIYQTGVDVRYGDKLITLSTCAYHVKDGRFAVIAKKVK